MIGVLGAYLPRRKYIYRLIHHYWGHDMRWVTSWGFCVRCDRQLHQTPLGGFK